MTIKIIFNNYSLNEKFDNGWGFSCLVGNNILFDAGERSEYLFNNMKLMDINIKDIETVVISHDHWDHTGGLWELLRKKKGIKVYSCADFSEGFKEKVKKSGGILKEVDKFMKVAENIYTTGQITGRYKDNYIAEQVLVVKTKIGLVVITGCSHPGIQKIIKIIKENFPKETINLAFGGFHLMDKDRREIKLITGELKAMGVKKVGPCHCTGYEAQAIFKEFYGDDFINIRAGQIFEV